MPDHAPSVTVGPETAEHTTASGTSGGTSGGPSRIVVAATALAGVVLVLGTIGPPLFGRGVFLASDLLEHAFPWQAVQDGPPDFSHHGPVSDTVDAVYPSRVTFFDALRDGEFLAWSPDVAGGHARGSESSAGVLDPFAFSAYMVAPDWYAPAMIKLLTLAAAIGFTYLFCRRLGTGRAPALFAGLAFAGSGFMVMWTNWPQTEVAALIPALFWATERFLQRPRVLTAVPISLVVAAMLLGNFPAVVFYACYLLGPYALVRVAMIYRQSAASEALPGQPPSANGRSARWSPWRPACTSLGGAGVALVAGALLVAVVLVPFLLDLGNLGTGDRAQGPDANLQVPTLLTAVAPKAFGLSTEGPADAYFGPGNQVESIAFVGVTTALLALVGLALPRLRSTPAGAREVLVGGTVVLGWATFVGGPVLALLQNLPAFDNSFVGRTRSILGFTMAVLAGLGLQALLDRRWPATRAQWRWAAGVVGVGALLAAVVGWRALSLARDAERVPTLRAGLILPVIVGLLACGAVALIWLGRHRLVTVAALATLPLLLAVESLDLSLPLLPNEDRDTLYPTTPGIELLADNLGDNRLAPEDWTLFGSASAVYGLRSVAGHSFYTDEWKDALLAADPGAFSQSPTFPFLAGTPEVMGSPILDRLAVSWWAGPPSGNAATGSQPTAEGLRLIYDEDLRIYERTGALDRIRWAAEAEVLRRPAERLERLNSGDLPADTVVLNEAGPSADGQPAEVEVERDTPSHISVSVDAEGAGYLVVADSIQENWVATVDGESADLVDADHAGVAVHVPEGEHDIDLHYRPRGQRAGMAVSAITAVVLVAACAWDWRRRHSRRP